MVNEIVVLSPTILASFNDLVPILVKAVSDTIGVTRKNASITLAKLCQNEKNLELARSLHGTELLVNLHKYIMNP